MFAGNTTAIASLLFASAYSAQGDISAAAHNLSESIASAALPSAEQKQAITQTIQYALQYGYQFNFPSIRALMVLVTPALLANQADTIPDSFAQVHPLCIFRMHSLCYATCDNLLKESIETPPHVKDSIQKPPNAH